MRFARFLSLIILLCFLGNASAETDQLAEKFFNQALTGYEAEKYEVARQKAEQAIKLAPNESSYYHLLGKCYGRLAEKSNFIKAISLSKKTRQAFEKAVELDNKNTGALKDLMQFYRQAPGFLGGDKKKADEIEQLLTTLNIAS